jgi:hypothetical protein
MSRPQKMAFVEMRESGIRGVQVLGIGRLDSTRQKMLVFFLTPWMLLKDLRSQCLSHDPILHQHCLSYIAGVYEMTVWTGEVYELLNDPGRRLRPDQIGSKEALEQAQAFARAKRGRP